MPSNGIQAYRLQIALLLVGVLFAVTILVWTHYRPERFVEPPTPAYRLVYVHAPGCKYCDLFNPKWDKFVMELKAAGLKNVVTEKTTDGHKYGVEAFPSVVALKDGKVLKLVQGVQEPKAIWELLRSVMSV